MNLRRTEVGKIVVAVTLIIAMTIGWVTQMVLDHQKEENEKNRIVLAQAYKIASSPDQAQIDAAVASALAREAALRR
jgi:hypothetical protein